jgi:hypothetical protein
VDAVLLFANARAPLTAAVARLQSGGGLYWEIDRRRGRPRNVRGLLRRAGLTPVGAYWAWPDFAHTEVLVPVERPAALRWYLECVRGTWDSRGALLSAGLGLRPDLAMRVIDRLLPCLIVTAARGPVDAARLGVLSGANRLPVDARPLVLATGADTYSRVVLLPFAAGSRRPLVVLKAAQVAWRNPSIEHEQRSLATIRTLLSPRMRETVPRPLGSFGWGDVRIGIESCAPGQLLWARRQRRRLSALDDLRLVCHWLTEFQRQVAPDGAEPWTAEDIANWVERPLASYIESFGATADEADLFARARACAAALQGSRLPRVWQHWGLSDQNIYRDGQHLTVVDWEGGNPGLPVFDLLSFGAQWYQRAASERADPGAAVLLGRQPDPLAGALRAHLDAYVRSLEVDPRFLPLLGVLTWVLRALGRSNRNRSSGPESANARDGNPHLGVVSRLSRHAEELFGPATHA